MTDNEIIKALECCKDPECGRCNECPAYETYKDCIGCVLSEVIDLINRYEAEIERLKGWQDLLKAEKHFLIKAEAIKAFLSKARERSYKSNDWSHGEHPLVVELDDLETICEEMVGEG